MSLSGVFWSMYRSLRWSPGELAKWFSRFSARSQDRNLDIGQFGQGLPDMSVWAGVFEFLQMQYGDRFSCKDSCVHFLCLATKCFGDRNIEWRRIRPKNDLAEFFVDYGLAGLHSVSSDQEADGNLLDDLALDRKTQNSGSEASLEMAAAFGKYINKTT